MELAVGHRTPSSSTRDDAVRNVLEELGERVKPVSMARERTLPVTGVLSGIFPDGGLIRGQVMSCRGSAASTIVCAVVRDAVVAGAWLAVVDVDTFGADAVAELGIPLERVVRIDSGCRPDEGGAGDDGSGSELDWVDVMGAAVDGFDLIITRVPAALRSERRPAAVRKLATRLQQRGAVVVTLGPSGALGCDVEVVTRRAVWSGLADGSGHLRRRHVDIEAGGRRRSGTRHCSLTLAASGQRVEISAADPQEEVLAEMTRHLDGDVAVRPLAG